MTRKDYVMIADTIREALADIARLEARETISDRGRTHLDGERVAVRDLAYRLGNQLRQNNPRFEMGTFLKACGIAA
jgi:hypothetical protein